MTPPDLKTQYQRHVEERGDDAMSYVEWLEHSLKDYQDRDQEFRRQSLRPALVIVPRKDHSRYDDDGNRHMFFEDHRMAFDVMVAMCGLMAKIEVYRAGEKPAMQEKLL